MKCIELKFDVHCQACKEPLKVGELALIDKDKRVFCVEGCLSKPDDTKAKSDIYSTTAPAKRKAKTMQVHAPTRKDRKNDLTHNPMAGKLRDDINKMAKGA